MDFKNFLKQKIEAGEIQLPLSKENFAEMKNLYDNTYPEQKPVPDQEPRIVPIEDTSALTETKSIIDSVKFAVFHIAAMPVSSERTKRKTLEDKLTGDEFLNDYVDKKIKRHFIKWINDDVKAVLVYGYHFQNTK